MPLVSIAHLSASGSSLLTQTPASVSPSIVPLVALKIKVQKPTSCSQKSLKIIILNLFYRDTSCRAGFGTGRPGQLGCEKSKSNFGFQRIGTCIENEKVVQFVRLQFAKLYLVLFSLLFQNLPFKAGGTLELKSLKNKAENCFLLEKN